MPTGWTATTTISTATASATTLTRVELESCTVEYPTNYTYTMYTDYNEDTLYIEKKCNGECGRLCKECMKDPRSALSF